MGSAVGGAVTLALSPGLTCGVRRALGKGIGLIVGGAVLCALKAIVTAIIGTDPTTMTFY